MWRPRSTGDVIPTLVDWPHGWSAAAGHCPDRGQVVCRRTICRVTGRVPTRRRAPARPREPLQTRHQGRAPHRRRPCRVGGHRLESARRRRDARALRAAAATPRSPRRPLGSASCDSWQIRRCRAPTSRLPSSTCSTAASRAVVFPQRRWGRVGSSDRCRRARELRRARGAAALSRSSPGAPNRGAPRWADTV